MPVDRTHRLHFFRHFPPITMQCDMKRERVPSFPPLTIQTVVQREARGSKTVRPRRDANELIPKPKGEVTRLARGGYTLSESLQWEEVVYAEVQVSLKHRFEWNLANVLIIWLAVSEMYTRTCRQTSRPEMYLFKAV